MIFEFSHANPIVERMQKHCPHAGEFMHSDSLTLLEAERNCRSCISEWLNPRSHFLQIATTEKWTSVQLKSSHLFLCRHFAAMAYLAEKMLEVLHVMSAGEKTESTNVFNTIGQVGALSTRRSKPTYARMHMTLSFISMEPL